MLIQMDIDLVAMVLTRIVMEFRETTEFNSGFIEPVYEAIVQTVGVIMWIGYVLI
jgi:hypothetical protein